jgi:hypothetical protein
MDSTMQAEANRKSRLGINCQAALDYRHNALVSVELPEMRAVRLNMMKPGWMKSYLPMAWGSTSMTSFSISD